MEAKPSFPDNRTSNVLAWKNVPAETSAEPMDAIANFDIKNKSCEHERGIENPTYNRNGNCWPYFT